MHDGSETTSDSFTYKVNDGTSDSNEATVTIAVNSINDAPLVADDGYTAAEGGTLNIAAPGVLSNDTDVDNIATELVALQLTDPAHGTLTFNSNGSFTYVHDGSDTTSDSFTYKANDGSADSNTATVNITVTPANDAPVANNDAFTTNEDTALVVAVPQGVLANDTDVDGNTLSALLVTAPTHGTLALNLNGSFTYTPAQNFFGQDSFTYKANDGTADSNTVTVSITVNAVNDAPVVANDSYTTNEDTVLVVTALQGVLANDTDVDTIPTELVALQLTGPAHGTLTLNPNGSFTYTPSANYFGSDSFTYKVNDGTSDSNEATVTITVNSINDAPLAADDGFTVAEGGTLNIAAPGVLGNDADVDSSALSALLFAGPSHGTLTLNSNGSFTYVHDGSETTSDSFTYKVNDGLADSNVATVTIAVTPVNDAPTLTAINALTGASEDTAFSITYAMLAAAANAADVDVDGGPVSFRLEAVSNGTLTKNGQPVVPGTTLLGPNETLIWTPALDATGLLIAFTVKAFDGLLASANAAQVQVQVAPAAVNDAPVANSDSATTNEDTPVVPLCQDRCRMREQMESGARERKRK